MLHAARHALILLAVALVALPAVAGEGSVPKPVIKIENADTKCVAPPEEMRRNHMEMLKHQRDKTLRQGVRGAPVSLNGCINCHASKKTGSVTGSNENFCQTCHAYVAVKLDCWDCHQPKANFKATGVVPFGHETSATSTTGAKP